MTVAQRIFINTVAPLASADMESGRILASLTIAQAILESAWGTSGLAVNAKALFGIKAANGWQGKVYSSETKECYDGVSFTNVTALFRAYNSWQESITDHSIFLNVNARYKAVVGETDYRKACHAIKDAGYATDPNYPSKLINIIETYNLTQYDKVGIKMGKRILIDPGHAPGNANKGKNGYYEYIGMWKVSNYLKAALERCGCITALTRGEKEDPTLTARGKKAAGYDLFISEHSNAANGTARGVETYYSVKLPNDKGFAAALSKAVAGVMCNPDRGAKTRESTNEKGSDYYTVMYYAKAAGCPHVFLVESGFHDNIQDEAFLLRDENLKAIAEAQAKVICDNLGITYKPADADLTLAIDGQVIGINEAENINGRWHISIPQLGLNKVAIRDVLQGLGYTVGWEETNRVIIATK